MVKPLNTSVLIALSTANRSEPGFEQHWPTPVEGFYNSWFLFWSIGFFSRHKNMSMLDKSVNNRWSNIRTCQTLLDIWKRAMSFLQARLWQGCGKVVTRFIYKVHCRQLAALKGFSGYRCLCRAFLAIGQPGSPFAWLRSLSRWANKAESLIKRSARAHWAKSKSLSIWFFWTLIAWSVFLIFPA